MRHSLKVRIGTLVLVAAMAMPALAAPRRDDSPVDNVFERAISRLVEKIICIFDLSSDVTIPK
jgi:hypothetical protein